MDVLDYHGMNSFDGRSTFTLVPEIADWLAGHSPDTLLLAAGGIADGRGLAASLMLGADGALIGSRLWATEESLATATAKKESLNVNGDGTARSSVFDILRQKNWPKQFDFRAIRNRLHRKWENRLEELQSSPDDAIQDYQEGVRHEDYDRAHITVGEAVGMINGIEPAEEVIRTISTDAWELLVGCLLAVRGAYESRSRVRDEVLSVLGVLAITSSLRFLHWVSVGLFFYSLYRLAFTGKIGLSFIAIY